MASIIASRKLNQPFVACVNRTPRGTITAPLPEGSCHVVTEGWEVATRD
ncbi:MAG: hypothetical protein IJB60_08095 [Bacteroidaceae bacterium]|nr:hypothetical protein [Bacteroidaceae bacterium]